MTALAEAVEINQVHNRDPIGGSNENLFLLVVYFQISCYSLFSNMLFLGHC